MISGVKLCGSRIYVESNRSELNRKRAILLSRIHQLVYAAQKHSALSLYSEANTHVLRDSTRKLLFAIGWGVIFARKLFWHAILPRNYHLQTLTNMAVCLVSMYNLGEISDKT